MAAQVLRRSLLVWGLGYLALGDRRGWLLMLLEPLAIVALLGLGWLAIDGTRWMVIFPALLLVLGVWLGQALTAYARARALGSSRGGELQSAAFLPLAGTLVTLFWLIGGTASSPATTLGRYVSAWENGRAGDAARLFVTPAAPADLDTAWAGQNSYLAARLQAAEDEFGSLSGIDPDEPFNSLRFEQLPGGGADQLTVEVDIVRRQRVETVLLGFIPTATQQTVVVERLGTISLRSVPIDPPAWATGLDLGARAWRIESVELASDAPQSFRPHLPAGTTLVGVVDNLVDNGIVTY
jgi:hypothetical protein